MNSSLRQMKALNETYHLPSKNSRITPLLRTASHNNANNNVINNSRINTLAALGILGSN